MKRKGKGWTGDSLRHSRARKFGRAGGTYAATGSNYILKKKSVSATKTRDFLHFNCSKCRTKVHKKGLCSDCLLKPSKKVITYAEMTKKHKKDIEDFPMFFAFSQEQFDEGLKKFKLKKGEKLIRTGYGGFIRKSDKDKYIEMNKRHDKEHKELMKNKDFAYEMFRYELGNHEYVITYDDDDTLRSLGLTKAKVDKSPMLSAQLEKAKKDYLKEADEKGWG